MKKIIALLLAVVMVLGLAACDNDTPETTAPSQPAETTSTAPAAPATYTWKDSGFLAISFTP